MIANMVVASADDFAGSVAQHIARAIVESVRTRGVCSIALAGGGTPAPVYKELAKLELPWEQVRLFFGDERCVPPDHEASNYRMVRETLLTHALPSRAKVVRMKGELAARDAAALEYERELPDVLDLVLLGMGSDGHAASLFAGDPAILDTERKVAAVEGPSTPRHRLTLTGPFIASAKRIFVMVTGASKAEMVARALGGNDPLELPVRVALAGTWFLDREAAAVVTGWR